MTSPITSISPIDGRYHHKTQALIPFFSEYGLFHYRVIAEIEWLKALANEPAITELAPFSPATLKALDNIKDDFSVADAEAIKGFEQTTNHDIKAIEYFIRTKMQENEGLKSSMSFIHFAATSEDINNIAYALILAQARQQILLPKLKQLIMTLEHLATEHKTVAMLSRTHGQTASPTTFGKEILVFAERLKRQKTQLAELKILAKMNGAVGNYNAHLVAYPQVDWVSVSTKFITSLGLVPNLYTTQIEDHDYIAEYCHVICRINNIILDLCRDIWSYISLHYLKLKFNPDEIGSSTMPHKINPIDFENAEGNLGIANSLFTHLAAKLPISRWQRDLSDSTALRNLGVGIGHTLIALESCHAGLNKLSIDDAVIAKDLENAWEVLAEPIQTVMRQHGELEAYEKLKTLTRGQAINQKTLDQFIQQLDIPKPSKEKLLKLSPKTYIGNASNNQ